MSKARSKVAATCRSRDPTGSDPTDFFEIWWVNTFKTSDYCAKMVNLGKPHFLRYYGSKVKVIDLRTPSIFLKFRFSLQLYFLKRMVVVAKLGKP